MTFGRVFGALAAAPGGVADPARRASVLAGAPRSTVRARLTLGAAARLARALDGARALAPAFDFTALPVPRAATRAPPRLAVVVAVADVARPRWVLLATPPLCLLADRVAVGWLFLVAWPVDLVDRAAGVDARPDAAAPLRVPARRAGFDERDVRGMKLGPQKSPRASDRS